MNKEVMWNNEKWVVDYKTRTIYQKAIVFEDCKDLLTIHAIIGDYRFREIRDIIYFNTTNNFYKIANNEVIAITKEEYNKLRNLKRLKINEEHSVRYISAYVSSILIDKVLKEKYNIRISTKVENSRIFLSISNGFSEVTKSKIDYIANTIISTRSDIDVTIVKKEVNKSLLSMFGNNSEFLSKMINEIYENGKLVFDYFVTLINKRIEMRKQLMSANSQNNNAFVSENTPLHTSEETKTFKKVK